MDQLNKDIEQKHYKLKVSNSSFRLSEVTSFTFGPIVSRFWMLRKHTICMDRIQLNNDAPFYAWNCITISLKQKCDIYLIIKNEKVMHDFIKLLISKLQTVDGFRDSAIPLKALLLKKMKNDYVKTHSKVPTDS